MRIAAGVARGEIAYSGKLPVLEDAVGNAQPAHISLLVGRAVEQTEEAPAEIVVRVGRFVLRYLRLEPLIAVEGMQLALELLRIGKFLSFLDDAILCAQMRGVRADGLCRDRAGSSGGRAGRRCGRAGNAGDLQARHEAFEIALLFRIKIARHIRIRL